MNLVESKTTVYYSNYSNGDIQIVLFGIQSCSKTEYIGIQYSIISQKPNIFGIWSILTIRENTKLNASHLKNLWFTTEKNVYRIFSKVLVDSPWEVDSVRHWNLSICSKNKEVITLLVKGYNH